jgi:Fic family protein
MYIHERKEWPNFTWNETQLMGLLAEVRHLQGHLLGRMSALGFEFRQEATLVTLTQDVIKTSEIEGEKLEPQQVRSSIAKRLGIDIGGSLPLDRNVEGIVQIMLNATGRYDLPLTKERLMNWHTALFHIHRHEFNPITVGAWRGETSGPMQVISGPLGREKIHYEAPGYDLLKTEMRTFLKWVEDGPEIDPVLKAAIAHFWFITIHPFDDGNGRIARAITDLLLEKTKQRFYSMSSQIQQDRSAYYNILERCQKGSLDITVWLQWFLNCLKRAIHRSEKTLEAVLTKAKFWKIHSEKPFNNRQRDILNRLLDGFEGKLTSSKWAKLTKCSQDTALRDIADLVKFKILTKDAAGGRSTSYHLNYD